MSSIDQLAELTEPARAWHLALNGDAQTRVDAWREAGRFAKLMVDDLEIPVPACWYVHAGVVVALLGLQYEWDNARTCLGLFFDADRVAHCEPWGTALRHSLARHPCKEAPEQEESLPSFEAYIATFQLPAPVHSIAPPQRDP